MAENKPTTPTPKPKFNWGAFAPKRGKSKGKGSRGTPKGGGS